MGAVVNVQVIVRLWQRRLEVERVAVHQLVTWMAAFGYRWLVVDALGADSAGESQPSQCTCEVQRQPFCWIVLVDQS
jgi:hypothetical protein